MISWYADCSNVDRAAKFFNTAPRKSIVAWTAMLTGYVKLERIKLAERMPTKNLVT
uniref:Pentatricopeptide repeat-containing protein n=1 Tax=Rhizophora mucronata TaxID=61149 RepID=A0A2P2KPJ6_RHIMU